MRRPPILVLLATFALTAACSRARRSDTTQTRVGISRDPAEPAGAPSAAATGATAPTPAAGARAPAPSEPPITAGVPIIRSGGGFDPIAYWTERLVDGSREERLAATIGLGLTGQASEQVVTPLLTMLDDPDPVGRRLAVEAIGRIGVGTEAIRSRMDAIAADDADPDVRAAATSALAVLGGPGDGGVAAGVGAVSPSAATLRASVPVGGVRTMSAAQERMTDLDEGVRAQAIRDVASFGQLATPAVEDVIRALRDDSPLVRREAAAALGALGRAPVRTILPTADSRALPPAALGPSGSDAIAGLAGLLDDADPTVRLAAVQAIGLIGPAASGAAGELEDAARDDDDPAIRHAAAAAFASVGGR